MMQVVRSTGEPTITYIIVDDAEATELRDALRKGKSPLIRKLRKGLKEVLRAR